MSKWSMQQSSSTTLEKHLSSVYVYTHNQLCLLCAQTKHMKWKNNNNIMLYYIEWKWKPCTTVFVCFSCLVRRDENVEWKIGISVSEGAWFSCIEFNVQCSFVNTKGSIERTTLLAVEPNNQAKIEFHILCIKIASRNINNKGKLINRNYSTHTSTSTSTFHVMNIEHWTEWTSRRRIAASVTSLLLAQWTDTLCV